MEDGIYYVLPTSNEPDVSLKPLISQRVFQRQTCFVSLNPTWVTCQCCGPFGWDGGENRKGAGKDPIGDASKDWKVCTHPSRSTGWCRPESLRMVPRPGGKFFGAMGGAGSNGNVGGPDLDCIVVVSGEAGRDKSLLFCLSDTSSQCSG